METKWTPGPWTAKWSKYEDETFIVQAGMPSNRVLAHFDGDGDGPDEQSLADARLIAAAPDLYAGGEAQTGILCRAQAILTQYLIPDGIDGPEAINQLLGLLDGPDQRAAQSKWDAAIAKARGEV